MRSRRPSGVPFKRPSGTARATMFALHRTRADGAYAPRPLDRAAWHFCWSSGAGMHRRVLSAFAHRCIAIERSGRSECRLSGRCRASRRSAGARGSGSLVLASSGVVSPDGALRSRRPRPPLAPRRTARPAVWVRGRSRCRRPAFALRRDRRAARAS
jgi:hypothetical protein